MDQRFRLDLSYRSVYVYKFLFFNFYPTNIRYAYNLATSLLILFSLRAIHGFSWGFASTGAGTIASDIVPAARRGEGMGYYGLASTLAMAVGPVLSLFILDRYGFHTLFTAGSILSAISLLCLLGIKSFESNIHKGKTKISLNSFLEPRVYSLSVVLFFVNLTYGGIVSFITLYAKELNIANAGIFFMVYGLWSMVYQFCLLDPMQGRSLIKVVPIK